ncbi:DHH family phosphoesterase [[Mycoplasma] mobile]|uniref:Predicted signaling protein n=1 Tax=Mycoplasma mobile (strain ATCC 43663 / 163K / NCTC 11711) TaxID=267748 RepID=Q6KIB7_MYCM1|nr:DHH family phosphoesterase [[Mycoplasma] mobile]AAT27659.1 predicted signaling protein [Mycoplasma mobile 163K]
MSWKPKIIFLSLIVLNLIVTIVSFLLIGFLLQELLDKILFSLLTLVFSLIILGVFSISFYLINKKEVNKNYVLNNYIEKIVAENGLGLIIISDKSKIIWASEFINQRFKENVVGKNVTSISKKIETMLLNAEKNTTIELEGFHYFVNYIYQSNVLVFKDVTKEVSAIMQYDAEKIVIGEVDIDNFQEYQSSLNEEDLFSIQYKVIDMLEKLVKNYNVSYRQYVNGKFLLITNEETLNQFIDSKFNFLDSLRAQKVEEFRLSVSIGLSKRGNSISELMELAKDALRQSKSRGGDQITVWSKNEKPIYFGSKSEIAINPSRTKAKDVATLLLKKMEDQSITKVILYGHIMADLDAIGSTFALSEIAKYFKKEVYIQNVIIDETSQRTINKYFTLAEKELFIKKQKAISLTDKNTLVIVCDTAEIDRIENPEAFDKALIENIFILDHHRVSKLPENIEYKNTFIDTGSSSACEITTEIISFMSLGKIISKKAAQFLLNGIYLDTNQFQKATSSKTFAAASLLNEWGAQVVESVNVLKMDIKTREIVDSILAELREIKKGFYLASYDGPIPSEVVSIAADEILRVSGRKAAFVIAKSSNGDSYKLSARGIETNVQIIAEAVGGGGHYSAAAAVSNESLTVFTDNVIQAIVSANTEIA